MASGDATPIPIRAQAFRVTFPILDADGDIVTSAASLDSEISKDAGTFADCTNEATEIATSSGVYYLDLSAAEMTADTVAIIVKTSTTDAKTTILTLYPATADGLELPVDTKAIGSSTTAPTQLALSANQIITGTVDTGSFTPTTTQFEADDITEATADHYNGRIVIFTSGALAGQASDITDYVLSGSNGKFTVTAMTEAAGNNDTFVVI